MFKSAVTGTNGKTSTIFLASQLIMAGGYECATLGTLGLISNNYSDLNPVLVGQNAMEDIVVELFHLYETEAFVFEAFSSCIEGRLYDKMNLDLAAITNISVDHLEYHGSKQQYHEAKLRLFKEILRPGKHAVFCSDGALAEEMLNICSKRNLNSFSFGMSKTAHLRLLRIDDFSEKTKVLIQYKNLEYSIDLSFGGEIFIYNWLCAMSIALILGIGITSLIPVCDSLKLPPGRLEKIGTKKRASIYIDYAHNASALRAVLRILRTKTEGQLHLVFGCGGNRDISKRKDMGQTAFELADKIYITNDNVRYEDANQIRLDILKHCPNGITYNNRNFAIAEAIKALQPKDILLIAGKGHETHMEIKGKKRKFSDRDIVLKILANF